MKAEEAERIYRLTQDAVRLADTKAGILLAVDAALLGFSGARLQDIGKIVHRLETLPDLIALLAWLGVLIGIVVSAVWLLAAIRPRLNLSKSSSLVYFAHIDKAFKGKPDEYNQRLSALDNNGLFREYTDQILDTSGLCTRKHLCTTSAIKWLGIALISWIVLAVTLACGSCGR